MRTDSKTFNVIATVITIVTAVVICFNIVFYTRDAFSYNLRSLPEGEFLYSSSSPTMKYVMKSYYIEGSPTLNESVRCEIVETETDKTYNIYWQTGTETVQSNWSANDVININGVNINLTKGETYDWREVNTE